MFRMVSMQKSVKKITHEKECNIGTDHQCKVENVQQCGQVPEQEKVREYNLVNNLVYNGYHQGCKARKVISEVYTSLVLQYTVSGR